MKTRKKLKTSGTYGRSENPELQKVVAALRTFVKAAVPGAKETANSWGVPTFETTNPFSGYMVGKKHVTFLFHFGNSLPDPEKLLEGTGRNIRYVKLFGVENPKRKGLRQLVRAAARLKKATMRGMSGQN
jgi:hypothetical protein